MKFLLIFVYLILVLLLCLNLFINTIYVNKYLSEFNIVPLVTEEKPSININLSCIPPIDRNVRGHAYALFCNEFSIEAPHEKIMDVIEGKLEEIVSENEKVKLMIDKKHVQIYGGFPRLASEYSKSISDYSYEIDREIFGDYWHGGND